MQVFGMNMDSGKSSTREEEGIITLLVHPAFAYLIGKNIFSIPLLRTEGENKFLPALR